MMVVKSVTSRLDIETMNLLNADKVIVFPFDGEMGLVIRKDDGKWVVEVTYQGEWVPSWDAPGSIDPEK